MAKNVPAPLETGDFGGGESGTKQGVRRTEVENEKNENTTYYTILLIALFLLIFKGYISSACLKFF